MDARAAAARRLALQPAGDPPECVDHNPHQFLVRRIAHGPQLLAAVLQMDAGQQEAVDKDCESYDMQDEDGGQHP